MPDDRTCQVIEHLEARPLRPRRGWSVEAKTRLVEETLAPGANVSAIARGAGISPSQLFGWRRRVMAREPVASAGGDSQPMTFTRFETGHCAVVEIVVGDIVVRAGRDIDGDHLATVLRAVRGA
nr:transposase [Bradyrhizobium uaiense]